MAMHETSTNPSQTILDYDVRRVHELTEELRTDDSFWGGGAAGRWSTPQVVPHPHMGSGSTNWSRWVLKFKSEDTKSEGRKVRMDLRRVKGQG